MLRLALKSVRHNPKRLILTAIAVALGVSLVAATFTFTSALSRGFTDLFSQIYSTIDVVVEPDPNADITVDPTSKEGMFSQADLDAVSAIDGVAAAEGNVGFERGLLLNKEGDAPLGQGAPTLVYNWTGTPDLDNATLIEGRGPEADGEVVVDVDTWKKLGIAFGDTWSIATDSGVEQVTVVGTVRFGEDNNLQTANLLFATDATVRELNGGYEGYYGISVLVDEGSSPDTVAAAINEILPENTRAVTAETKAKEQSDAIDDMMRYVNIFAIVFGLIALFVGAYIIVNTFRIIVTQRTRELGLLRAIGAQGKQIRSMILLEALAVGFAASTLGIALGWLLAFIISAIVESFAGDILATMILPIDALIWCYGLGLFVTLVAALLPAIHAAQISPMEALREAGTAGKKPLTARNIVGGSFAALGIASVIVGLYVSVPRPYIWVGAGAVLVVLGVTLLAAQVLVPMAYGLRGVLTKVWGVNGKIAANNIRREPRRSANTAAALMIGVMLLALVATFTESLKDTFTSQFKGNEAELFVVAQTGPLPQGAMDAIAGVDGVADVARWAMTDVTVDGTSYSASIVDANELDGLFDLPTDLPLSELGDGVIIDPVIQELGYKVGDMITLEGPDGSATVKIAAFYDREADQNFLVGWNVGTQLVKEPVIMQALVNFDDDADVEATEDAVSDALSEEFPLVVAQSPSYLEKLVNQTLDVLLGIISGLLGAALVIAILGVANTLLLSVTERTREIGLLRAVGIKRGDVWAMVTLESVVMAVFGTILGIILGTGLGAAIVEALGEYGFDRAVVPWAWIGIYTVLSMIAGVVAAVWPAWRASRLDILQAIAADG